MGTLDFSRRRDHRFSHYVRLFERHKVRLVNHAIECMPVAVRTRRGPTPLTKRPWTIARQTDRLFSPSGHQPPRSQ
jgi:hypothetical protein